MALDLGTELGKRLLEGFLVGFKLGVAIVGSCLRSPALHQLPSLCAYQILSLLLPETHCELLSLLHGILVHGFTVIASNLRFMKFLRNSAFSSTIFIFTSECLYNNNEDSTRSSSSSRSCDGKKAIPLIRAGGGNHP